MFAKTKRNETAVGLATLIWVAGVAMTAGAQANPELGDVAPSAGGQASAGGTFDASANGAAAGSTDGTSDGAMAGPATPQMAGDSDHAGVVGRFGVGFFGVQQLPIFGCNIADAGCVGSPGSVGEISAPTIGARYWLQENLGIEGALGLVVSGGSTDVQTVTGAMSTTTTFDDPSQFGFALHGGVPLVLAHSGHFSFEVVPQLNFGLTSGTYTSAQMSPATDIDVSGYLFELGGKVGAEIQFGFIGIPQLSLQGLVGVGLRLEGRSGSRDNDGVGNKLTVDQGRTVFSTSLDGEPWDIFTGAITAIYYL